MTPYIGIRTNYLEALDLSKKTVDLSQPVQLTQPTTSAAHGAQLYCFTPSFTQYRGTARQEQERGTRIMEPRRITVESITPVSNADTNVLARPTIAVTYKQPYSGTLSTVAGIIAEITATNDGDAVLSIDATKQTRSEQKLRCFYNDIGLIYTTATGSSARIHTLQLFAFTDTDMQNLAQYSEITRRFEDSIAACARSDNASIDKRENQLRALDAQLTEIKKYANLF